MTKARPTGKQAASAATYQQLRVHALVANPLQPLGDVAKIAHQRPHAVHRRREHPGHSNGDAGQRAHARASGLENPEQAYQPYTHNLLTSLAHINTLLPNCLQCSFDSMRKFDPAHSAGSTCAWGEHPRLARVSTPSSCEYERQAPKLFSSAQLIHMNSSIAHIYYC